MDLSQFDMFSQEYLDMLVEERESLDAINNCSVLVIELIKRDISFEDLFGLGYIPSFCFHEYWIIDQLRDKYSYRSLFAKYKCFDRWRLDYCVFASQFFKRERFSGSWAKWQLKCMMLIFLHEKRYDACKELLRAALHTKSINMCKFVLRLFMEKPMDEIKNVINEFSDSIMELLGDKCDVEVLDVLNEPGKGVEWFKSVKAVEKKEQELGWS